MKIKQQNYFIVQQKWLNCESDVQLCSSVYDYKIGLAHQFFQMYRDFAAPKFVRILHTGDFKLITCQLRRSFTRIDKFTTHIGWSLFRVFRF